MPRLPNPIDVHVGSRLRVRRTSLGLSQERLAQHLGVTVQQIRDYEDGTKRISASRLHKLAEVLEVPITYFFEDLPGLSEDSPEPPWQDADDPQPTLVDLLTQQDGIELARAFVRIQNPRLRRMLVDLARTVADETAAAEAGADRQ